MHWVMWGGGGEGGGGFTTTSGNFCGPIFIPLGICYRPRGLLKTIILIAG